MKLLIFSIYDCKAKTWTRPTFDRTVGNHIRLFQELANDNNHPIGKHPADYTLFQIGEFNESTGEIESFATPTSHGVAVTYRNRSTATHPIRADLDNTKKEENDEVSNGA